MIPPVEILVNDEPLSPEFNTAMKDWKDLSLAETCVIRKHFNKNHQCIERCSMCWFRWK